MDLMRKLIHIKLWGDYCFRIAIISMRSWLSWLATVF